MKEVPKKDQPEVSGGGVYVPDGYPRPSLPFLDDPGYPKWPFVPVVEEAYSNTIEEPK